MDDSDVLEQVLVVLERMGEFDALAADAKAASAAVLRIIDVLSDGREVGFEWLDDE